MSDGASIEAQLVAHEGATGLVLLRTTGAGTVVPAPLDNTRVEPGSLPASAVQWGPPHRRAGVCDGCE
jgi:hypothetical protein